MGTKGKGENGYAQKNMPSPSSDDLGMVGQESVFPESAVGSTNVAGALPPEPEEHPASGERNLPSDESATQSASDDQSRPSSYSAELYGKTCVRVRKFTVRPEP